MEKAAVPEITAQKEIVESMINEIKIGDVRWHLNKYNKPEQVIFTDVVNEYAICNNINDASIKYAESIKCIANKYFMSKKELESSSNIVAYY